MTEKIYDVYGIGNPLIDLLVKVDDDILNQLNLHKGTMHLIDLDRREEILSLIENITFAPGGSCANTIITCVDLGLNAVYSGSINDDEFGKEFEKGMHEKGCETDLTHNSLPTGSSIILITKDAERTQNTYLGACQQYSIADINKEKIAQSKFLYFTGYMWDTDSQKEALEEAIKVAKQNDTKIIFDVADPFAVNRSKDDFIRIIQENADFVLANFEEARMFTEKDTIEEILHEMKKYINFGVIKDGVNGSYIFKDEDVFKIETYKVKAIDTTGAGDIYASGILYGLTRGYDLQRTGRIASYAAAKCVENIGARLEISLRDIADTL